jgi:hypothetical protein
MATLHVRVKNSKGKIVSCSDNDKIVVELVHKNALIKVIALKALHGTVEGDLWEVVDEYPSRDKRGETCLTCNNTGWISGEEYCLNCNPKGLYKGKKQSGEKVEYHPQAQYIDCALMGCDYCRKCGWTGR